MVAHVAGSAAQNARGQVTSETASSDRIDETSRARTEVAAWLARWRAQLPAAEVPAKARALAAAIRSDMAAGADRAQGEAMLAELARAL
jgi:hypothetical protein